jgi:uncharacterized protein YjbI with pentapeptide repeats
MKTIEIKNRWTGAVLYATHVEDDDQHPIRTALEKAVVTGVNLIAVNLAYANLRDANLSGARLIGANLAYANLRGANLVNANLASAYLVGANLAYVNLRGACPVDANLARANLISANLSGARLTGVNLFGANLTSANLSAADLSGARLTGANLYSVDLTNANLAYTNFGVDHVPFVPRLDAQILERIESGQGKLYMYAWHTCETTHCRAGWAVTLAGEAGRTLEAKIGTAAAGALIYYRSTGRIPDFYASDEDALADIIACARAQGAPV